jgi:hypothetical protein
MFNGNDPQKLYRHRFKPKEARIKQYIVTELTET